MRAQISPDGEESFGTWSGPCARSPAVSATTSATSCTRAPARSVFSSMRCISARILRAIPPARLLLRRPSAPSERARTAVAKATAARTPNPALQAGARRLFFDESLVVASRSHPTFWDRSSRPCLRPSPCKGDEDVLAKALTCEFACRLGTSEHVRRHLSCYADVMHKKLRSAPFTCMRRLEWEYSAGAGPQSLVRASRIPTHGR